MPVVMKLVFLDSSGHAESFGINVAELPVRYFDFL